ncbi:hypothetical protein [Streptomyces xanthochromogenes]
MTTPPAPGPDEPSQVRITADGVTAHLEIESTDVTRMVRGYALEQQVGQPPTLALWLSPRADGTLFDGYARVGVATEPTGDTVAGFLANIDPAALERAALERDDLDGTRHELTRAMLGQLADWAQGRP